jgi:hypothetical protein
LISFQIVGAPSRKLKTSATGAIASIMNSPGRYQARWFKRIKPLVVIAIIAGLIGLLVGLAEGIRLASSHRRRCRHWES